MLEVPLSRHNDLYKVIDETWKAGNGPIKLVDEDGRPLGVIIRYQDYARLQQALEIIQRTQLMP